MLLLLPTSILVFRLEAQRFALALEAVERVVRAVEITALPGAPAVVLGVIDVAGEVVPVLSLRRRLGLRDRELAPDDQFVLVRLEGRRVALAIDAVETVARPSAGEAVAPGALPAGLGQVPGVVRISDGLALIQDLGKFFAPGEADALKAALREEADHGE